MNRARLSCALLATLVLLAAGCGRAGPQLNNEGNEAFEGQDYTEALEAYRAAQSEAPRPELAEPYYNSGNAQYRQERYDEAQDSYREALLHADEQVVEHGTFNVGNSLFKSDQLPEAVEAYKEALRLDPGDEDAKHNLELALRRQQEREAQAQQQEQQQDEQEGQEQEQPAPGDEGEDEQQSPQTEQAQTVPLSEEQARQLLQSIEQDTETLQERLQQVFVASGAAPAQDW